MTETTHPSPQQNSYDAVVVGSGPNGLAAAVTLARAGRSVLVVEAAPTVGGGSRSAELTLPGFVHDICSAIHPLGVGSPFFRDIPLAEHGLEWDFPPVALANPFDDGTAALLQRSLQATGETLGSDGGRYRALFGPLVEAAEGLLGDLLGPIGIPRHPIPFLRFGIGAMFPAALLARVCFRQNRAQTLFAGLAGHSMLPLEFPFTSSFGFVLGILGHAIGWPVARGGSQSIANALASYLRSLGGEIVTGWRVESIDELPRSRAVLFDTGPHQLVRIAGSRLPARYSRRLLRYRYGPAVFKVDWAMDGPIPWKAQECSLAGTVHLGGSLEEIAASEQAAWNGQQADRPFVLVAQQSLFDRTRAPEGKHTAWAYCHLPRGSTWDMTPRIEAQIERFAPGFRDRVLARRAMSPHDFEVYNPNNIGGDIAGGASDVTQLFTRPVARLDPYTTPTRGIYLCSSSTPPGAGVHGMCGYFAARSALRREFG